MLVPRESWGENVNRFYHRGLPKAEREKFVIDTRKGLRKRHPQLRVGARAYSDGVAIYPPEAWKPVRLVRRKGPLERRVSKSPLPIGVILTNAMPAIAATSAGRITQLSPARKARRSSMPGIPDAHAAQGEGRAAPPSLASGAPPSISGDPDRISNSGRGYRSSLQLRSRGSPDSPAEWLKRMQKHASDRPPPEKK